MKKMNGWLIVNAFLRGDKFSQLNQWLTESAARQEISLTLHTNQEFLVAYTGGGCEILHLTERPDFILFWDKDVTLAKAFEKAGIPVFNSADAIGACDDKAMTHRLLSGCGIPMPKTITAPMTFSGVGYGSFDFLDIVEREFSYPFVIKECFGSFGAQVYLVHDRRQAEQLLEKLSGKPLLFQEYIAKSAGRDIRINMVGGEPVAAMLRVNDHDFRANVTNGGSMQPYTPNERQIGIAREACRILKLDFAGVDLLFGDEGPLLCEVNSNAHVVNIYQCTGINVADRIMTYIRQRIEGNRR